MQRDLLEVQQANLLMLLALLQQSFFSETQQTVHPVCVPVNESAGSPVQPHVNMQFIYRMTVSM